MILFTLTIFLMVFLTFASIGYFIRRYAIKNPEIVWANVPVLRVRAGDANILPANWQNTVISDVTQNRDWMNWVHDRVLAHNKMYEMEYSTRYMVCEVDGDSSPNLNDKELFLTDQNYSISKLEIDDSIVFVKENSDPITYKMRCYSSHDKNYIYTTKIVNGKQEESCHSVSLYVGKEIFSTNQNSFTV